MNSSTAATLPFPHASSKNSRTRALFFSSADMGPPPLHIANSRFLRQVDTRDNATWRTPTHRQKAYSPKCLEGGFSDVRMLFCDVGHILRWSTDTRLRYE
jgi:hypothetical protein